MLIIRPVKKQDLDFLSGINCDSLLGMTNLPHNREKLMEKINISEKSFSKKVKKPGKESYTFVLEDLSTGKVGGTCGIIAQSLESFQYFYRVESIACNATHKASPRELKVLRVARNDSNSSEICALFLQPEFRHSGAGRLLSLSRFLFIAAFPHRFRQKIAAELRGYINDQKNSPFWEGVGRHFCNLSFSELMNQIERDHQFVPEILPKYPIYISLLSNETEDSIGKTHDQTLPAKQMLLNENFSFHEQVDIYEGGPIIFSETSNIRTIKSSVLADMIITQDDLTSQNQLLLGNEQIDFRACLGNIKIISKREVAISEEVAETLKIKNGGKIRYATLH